MAKLSSWPKYLIKGRVRTSTVLLVAAFIGLAAVYQVYEAPQPPRQVPANQVVPPGYVPDPAYTWVPRTVVQEEPQAPEKTEPEATEPEGTEETTTPTDTTPPTDTTGQSPRPGEPVSSPDPEASPTTTPSRAQPAPGSPAPAPTDPAPPG